MMTDRPAPRLKRDSLICALIVVATLLVYWQVGGHEFINYDDDEYVTENPHVQAGLEADSMVWAFTTGHAGNWHPVTWLSHMADCELFGMNPGGHHLTNLLLHVANALLLFLVLRMMTGAVWRSALVAALFALHPLHVESVAWVSERKDVLSTFFWMLTLWAYAGYVRSATTGRYLAVGLFFVLGLLAKPMLVTLPLVLLLLDYWPLGRLQAGRTVNTWRDVVDRRLVREKAPLFVAAAASCVVTFLVQRSGGAVASLRHYPLDMRIANACIAYVGYLAKMLWPLRLTVFYPYPGSIPWARLAGACLLLFLISAAALKNWRRRPYLLVGWLWYVITLLPVIGLIQVGGQAMADRYTYVPLIGVFIIISWSLGELADRWHCSKRIMGAAAVLFLLILGVLSSVQVGYWRNSTALFERALEVTTGNYMAHTNLGVALKKQGRFEGALRHYSEAIRIAPDFAEARYNMGNAMAEQGRLDEAIVHYTEALRASPDWALLRNNLGIAYAERGRFDEAAGQYAEAIRLEPGYVEARHNLGLALKAQGRLEEAIDTYSEGLRFTPGSAQLHADLALALAARGQLEEATRHYYEAVRLEPDRPQVRNNLGVVLAFQGRFQDAIDQYREALAVEPDYLQALLNLAAAHDGLGHYDEAIATYETVTELHPTNPLGYIGIARIHAKRDSVDESIEWLGRAVEAGFNDWHSIETGPDWQDIRNVPRYRELAEQYRPD